MMKRLFTEQPIVYVDMDGTLARWEAVDVKETFRRGYYAGRTPEPEMVHLIRMLKARGVDVRILSCAYANGYAAPEKNRWLDVQGLSDIPRIFVPYGEDKADYIPRFSGAILIDDYSPNLFAWEAQGNVGVKFYNGINGTHGTWRGASLDWRMTGEEMMERLFALMRPAAYQVALA